MRDLALKLKRRAMVWVTDSNAACRLSILEVNEKLSKLGVQLNWII